ncbi:MAG: 3-phosphoshikimate 1-carboxyvinyltransferase [Vibrionaceae bacterium]
MATTAQALTLPSIQKVFATVPLPGSKSLSNRALLLAALANGTTRLLNLLDSDDTRHMVQALRQLGVTVAHDKSSKVCEITGRGGPFSCQTLQTLFLGNAGTAMRPLAAALCVGEGTYQLTGEPRMQERPIADLVDALQQLGAQIDYLDKPGFVPLQIKARALAGATVELDGRLSSQFLTALLMMAPLLASDSEIVIKNDLVSKPYVEMTLRMMAQFGVVVEHDNLQRFYVKGNQTYQAVDPLFIEGDASSASYFLAAGAIAGEVKVTGINKNSWQGDVQFAQVLQRMGAQIIWGDDHVIARCGAGLQGVDLDCNAIPDAAMTLAVAALFATGTTTIRNVYNWRLKESDRLQAMACELKKVGAQVEEGRDFLRITPPAILQHACIDTYQDHRMAMCFSLLALSKASVTINDPACVSKTFPDYFAQFVQLAADKE